MLSILRILRKSGLLMMIGIVAFALFMALSERTGFAQGDLIRGRAIYGANCAICHGESGKGDGPKAAELQKKPINFTDPQVMGNISPAKFEKSVVAGKPGVPSHVFGHLLTHEEVRDVTYYVRSLIR